MNYFYLTILLIITKISGTLLLGPTPSQLNSYYNPPSLNLRVNNNVRSGSSSTGSGGSSSSSSRNNRTTNCLRGDCYPETGDLLIGRTKFLHASSTCGLTQPERYCVLGTTRDATKCFVCDSSEPYDPIRNTNSHTIENIVSRKQGDRFNRWWQSENGKQNVYIQFDLEAEFAFTHIIMTFKTFRPAAMIIEKSSNFGRTWKTYGYFASNCGESFSDIPTELPKNLGEVYCESKYSSETPSTKGEVVFRILPPTLIQSKDPYSNEIQELLKITNLRINFTKLHTFGDNLLDSREELKEKYYYALFEMVVRGSCLCYGHASRCIPVEGVQYDSDKNGMVDGQCECQHNTWGTNCEKCLPLFNDRPWRPARSGQTNECKKCQCHNHARSCHFDAELFTQTDGQTGGVCDDCQHNTVGNNCENCKENFWRDPERGIDDPSTCKPCSCELSGSTNDGKCDPYTNETLGLVAGQCHCKSLVEGARCDRCKNGYFNLTKENPEGCEPCSCNLIGTTGNLGCDKITGLCSCKRFVTGRACDQCLPGYFGLSADDPNGCKPCDCSPGGSLDSSCDAVTGDCKCKSNMSGRTCDRPENGFYCPTLDHYLYEAEDANKLDKRALDFTRPIYQDRKISWTGSGFVRAFEMSFLQFNVDNVFKSGHYEIVVRYELQPLSSKWNDIRILLQRESKPDPSDICADSPTEEDISYSLEAYTYYTVVKPPVCLEANKRFNVTLMFINQGGGGSGSSSREASILVDSLLLIPIVDELPALQGPDSLRLKDEFYHYGCKEAQLNVDKEGMNENCAKFICNIGVHNEYALPCECNPTGSLSNICNWIGGSCQCKTNVINRKCEECAPSTWGFGPNGCQPCNCNSGGAKNNFCDKETGNCDCYEKIQGKQCDKCQPNYWRFPTCEQCNCNGFADSCNETSGECIDCRDHTVGYNCESCKEGYYGKPTAGQPCKECMCPGIPAGNQFASTCYFDQSIDGVVCSCKEGYTGARCDKCATNYYGNPLERGGSCKMCQCNGNTDIYDPNSCDQATGKCRNCLYNTDGDYCEKCKHGFYGNASNHECRACNCDPTGTQDHSQLNCDPITGDCECLPNFVNKQCNACKQDHYRLPDESGCGYCDCDTDGTVDNSTSCDEYVGSCNCLESRGGRTCNQCSPGFWGDPNVECKKCQCSEEGSLSVQCSHLTGACQCKRGIIGHNCDACDRGTTGNIPYCTPCGECYDDWADILKQFETQLETLEEKASNLAVASGSTVKDFTAEYHQLEEKLSDIKKILSINYPDRQLRSLNETLLNIEKQLAIKKEDSNKYFAVETWNAENERNKLNQSEAKYKDLKLQIDSLNQQSLDLKESHEAGAIDSINKALKTSEEAFQTIETVKGKLNTELKSLLDSLKEKLDLSKQDFDSSDKKLKDFHNSIAQSLSNALNGVSNLNSAVCGEQTSEKDRCSTKCGGALCDGKCGTNSSSCPGLVDSYWSVISVRQNFEDLYTKQELVFKKILTKLRNSSNLLNNANKDVNSLLDYANKSFESINNRKKEINNLIETIVNYTDTNRDKPSQIEANADHAINKHVELKESELEEKLNKIAELASRISIEQIERDAETSRASSQELERDVERSASHLPVVYADFNNTQNDFELEKNKTSQVKSDLDEFVKSNEDIQQEINLSSINIENITKAMNDVQKSIEDLRTQADLDSKEKSSNLLAKQESLKSKVKESGVTLERTKISLETLRKNLDDLTKAFQNLIKNKDSKNGSDIFESLISLHSKIYQQKTNINDKANKIDKLQKVQEETKMRIDELKKSLSYLKDKANSIKKDIQVKERYFNSCG